MVTPIPTKLKNGVFGLNYILKGDAHVGDGPRNQYVSYVNLFEGVSPYKQFRDKWDLASKHNETQLRHFVISFSSNELSYDNESDIILAHEWSTEFFEKAFPGRQIIVATQTDGEGHKIHCHAMVNNCRISDGKGFTEKERTRGYFRKNATEFFKDKFEQNNIVYDYGKGMGSFGLYEREFADKLDEYKRYYDALKAEQAKPNPDKATIDECKAGMKANKYSWRAHLHRNIKACRNTSTSYDDFVSRLHDFGVIYDDSGKHNKYRLDPAEYANYTDRPYPDGKLCRGDRMDPLLARDELKAYFDSLTPAQKVEIIKIRNGIIPAPEVPEPTTVDTVTSEPEVAPKKAPVAATQVVKEPKEALAPVPQESEFNRLLNYETDLWDIPDDEDVDDEDLPFEDDVLVEAGFTDEIPDEWDESGDAIKDEENDIDWMRRIAEEYGNIDKAMKESGDESEHPDDIKYLSFF